jgi:hypothetical protein
MSALPPIATSIAFFGMSAFGPKADIVLRQMRGGESLLESGPPLNAAALELQQADELAPPFAKSNTKRLIGSADLIRSPDTSRS